MNDELKRYVDTPTLRAVSIKINGQPHYGWSEPYHNETAIVADPEHVVEVPR